MTKNPQVSQIYYCRYLNALGGAIFFTNTTLFQARCVSRNFPEVSGGSIFTVSVVIRL
jgi:hypothetical protein